MKHVIATWLSVAILIITSWWAHALERCDISSKTGDICLCGLSELHPTQAAVGMMEVRIRAEKLRQKKQGRSEEAFLKYLEKHDRIEPVVVGPSGVLYITDHHHLARALREIGVVVTYCRVLDNMSNSSPEKFWKSLQDRNEIHLEDGQGKIITPAELPTTIDALQDDPFRSLAGAVREACGFKKQSESASSTNYLEFEWADYLRANWAKTDIPIASINENFDSATKAALDLATQKEAAALPGYTGRASCN
jgi:hypothetical protein